MTVDRDAIAELFTAFGPVDVRPMFGGAGIYADGIFFALVDDGVIYLKADDETAPRFVAEGCSRFVYQARGRTVAMSYWRVPERLYDDTDELADWARQAHAAAVRAQAKKPRKLAGLPKTPKSRIRRRARSGPADTRDRSRK